MTTIVKHSETRDRFSIATYRRSLSILPEREDDSKPRYGRCWSHVAHTVNRRAFIHRFIVASTIGRVDKERGMDAKWSMMKSRLLNREMNISRSELCSTFILLIVVRVSRRTDVSIFKWKTFLPPLRIFDYFSITVILFLPPPSSSRDEFR